MASNGHVTSNMTRPRVPLRASPCFDSVTASELDVGRMLVPRLAGIAKHAARPNRRCHKMIRGADAEA